MAAAAAASSLLPFAPTRMPHSTAAKARTLTTQKPPRPPRPLAASSSPPPPEEAEPKDPIQLAFARAAAYKKERDSPPPPPPPPPPAPAPPPQPSVAKAEESRSGSKEAFARAVEYRNGNGGGLGDGGSALLGASPRFGQSTFASEDAAFGKFANKKEEYEYDETDFLGLDFFEKKSYKGPPPGLAPAADPFPDEDFPEVEIIIGDPSKFGKTRRSTEIQPADDNEPEETSHSTTEEKKEDNKLEETPPSTVTEPEDEDEDEYKPTVRSWGMFPRPQNISKAYGGGRNIRLGGEAQSAKEKAAKDKRTRELIAAYTNSQNMIVDAKTKAECSQALKEGDELMNTGRLKQALPYYEKVMQAVDFKTELHGMAALQWSICLDSLCRSKEAMSMYSKLKNHPNSEISKKANMFMFSFQAMDFMKVNSTPVSRNTGYENYFDKFGGRKNYYAALDEPEMGIDQIIPYMLFLVSPIFLVAFVALRKSFQL
ncbi:zinc finger CCCH domain-containing protein 18 isoform X1 [Oryza brachyantha]|uniref:zinc finger CCCH domain-containing protein 18 isoform X1 n=1 Tax=Oryza brachyantha TaxID=4533 RepID=UPI001ADB9E5A|nr:zinc finger CCCH domain-containing protein 18 isoform X1 [Oryza brachyantha]